MRITILTAGTRGDTQPYLALALGLQQAGHQVRLVGGENFAQWVEGYGVPFFPLRTNLLDMMNTPAAQAVMEADHPIQALIAQMRALRDVPVLDHVQAEIWEACQDAEAIIYHPGAIGGYFIARQRGIPCLVGSPFPLSSTQHWPSLILYNGPRLGAAYNQLTHTMFDQIFWQTFRPALKKFWQKQGQPGMVPFFSPSGRQQREQMPLLYAYSEHVLPRPADWPAHIHVPGYWFLDSEPDWQPATELVDFLQAGPPPVYMGFGSLGSPRRARETTEIAVRALALSGQRGLLISGWNSFSAEVALPENVLLLRDVPHSWLLPRVAAVVHHGGAGTTAAGLRAGRPSVIVPHSVDQPMWGRRVAELGAGPTPIPRKQLTAEKLAGAITAALQPGIRTQAEAIGRRIQAEDGVGRAVEIVDTYLRKGNYAQADLLESARR